MKTTINLANNLPWNHTPHIAKAWDKCIICASLLTEECTQKHRMIYEVENNYVAVYFAGFMCGSDSCSLRMVEMGSSTDVFNMSCCYSGPMFIEE